VLPPTSTPAIFVPGASSSGEPANAYPMPATTRTSATRAIPPSRRYPDRVRDRERTRPAVVVPCVVKVAQSYRPLMRETTRLPAVMGKLYDTIDDRLAEWIRRQALFFVGTAPSEGGHVNVSPKGPIESLSIVDDTTIEYEDHIGSGAETAAHIRENGRVCVMLCAFSGPPRIVRLHGRGEILREADPGADGVRAVIRVHLDRISD